ncbi:hypothetical protein [Yersinia massiliensis]|uniref:hypothetical protein n=2 Tax=Yersinia massiliensis TaxID=419257 RepID=UPI0011AAAD48|nr:hypothetical protein [Yersinia massiliensis]
MMEWIDIEVEEPALYQRIWVQSDQGNILCDYAGDRKIRNVEGFVEINYRNFVIQRWKPYIQE